MFEFIFYAAICGTALLYAFYKWATKNEEYFVKRQLKHFEPKFLVGNMLGLFTKKFVPAEFSESLYYRFPKEKLIGLFDMRQPVYLLRDLELIRQITIKDFDYFEDHIAFMPPESDTLFGKGLFLMAGKDWRDMRSTLSPAFTGSKMRHMFELVAECADEMTKHLSDSAGRANSIQWEMKELFSCFASDVIASCAFGLKANSLENPSNEFYSTGRSSIDFGSPKFAMRLFLIRFMTQLMRAIDFELFPVKTRKFFKSMVLETMMEREKNKIFRPDMINLLMEARKGDLKYQQNETDNVDAGFATVEESHVGKVQVKRAWTDDDIVAQCFLFFTAGFDTVSTLMSFMSYELAINQDIQERLHKEVKNFNSNLNGARLTYEAISQLKYLDQVISETLRKWPPVVFTNRLCTKDYECEVDDRKVLIERGTPVLMPVYSIHHDSAHYENPEKFDPERFSDENMHKIKPGSYLPFGIGPRNCIASRFSLMEIKALFFYLLLEFSIQPYEKTEIPLKLAKSAFAWDTENGIHLKFEKRT